jgi:hypothetical protein
MSTVRILTLVLTFFTLDVIAAAQESASAEGQRFQVESVWWGASPDITVQTGTLVDAGVGAVALADEFGMTRKWRPNIRATGRLAAAHRLRFEYLPLRFAERAILDRDIRFGNRVFTGAALADFRWSTWKAGYEWDFLRRARGALGLVVSANYNDVRAAVRAEGRGEVAAVEAFVPTVGLTARISAHPRVSVAPEVTLFKFSGGDVEGTFYDVDLGGAVSITRSLGVKAGYRLVSADYAAEQDTGELRMDGVYLGFVSRF